MYATNSKMVNIYYKAELISFEMKGVILNRFFRNKIFVHSIINNNNNETEIRFNRISKIIDNNIFLDD